MKDQGKNIIAQIFDDVLNYYILQTKANNNAIREAACLSLGELAQKISSETVKSHIHVIIHTLIKALKDNSWPVRDSACVALGHCIQ